MTTPGTFPVPEGLRLIATDLDGTPGVTKASTLAKLTARIDVEPSKVISFGDMPNDLTMLGWSGVGYAMTGGHPEAIAAADHLAPPAPEDGVAQVLEPYLAELHQDVTSTPTK